MSIAAIQRSPMRSTRSTPRGVRIISVAQRKSAWVTVTLSGALP